MLGGINAWIAAGYEVCDGQPQPNIGFLSESFFIVLILTTIVLLFVKSSKLKKNKKLKLRI